MIHPFLTHASCSSRLTGQACSPLWCNKWMRVRSRVWTTHSTPRNHIWRTGQTPCDVTHRFSEECFWSLFSLEADKLTNITLHSFWSNLSIHPHFWRNVGVKMRPGGRLMERQSWSANAKWWQRCSSSGSNINNNKTVHKEYKKIRLKIRKTEKTPRNTRN